MRVQKITLAAVALAAGLSLTACQGNEDTSAAGASDSAAPSESSSGSGGSGEGSTGGGGGAEEGGTSGGGEAADPAAGEGSGNGQINTGDCKTENLDIRASHGMGEGDVLVSLKNTGDACSLQGFPGVVLKADGGKGGINAERSDLDAPSVVVKSGEETRFTLHTPRNDTGGSGLDITRMLVTPPNETASKTVPVSINLPVSDKPVGGVTVDPVGTGKQ
ncbi:DUF4232 domain-containing protein [Streptomyces sp. HNM0574]|uniref:DUF4232 domain-containing protein n=1 Tax=Streptomyces sp. HNM0574 TaxID=2714954 RepID=UPI00146C0D71|nr:DUF4232 domain-containing protein [Streptomyces sp. HNM0574]NLU67901.1 DUF4232 domain-containing protein [Streptomyces sp. HNM0574]